MTKVLLRACPRCAGDVRVYRDLDGDVACSLLSLTGKSVLGRQAFVATLARVD